MAEHGVIDSIKEAVEKVVHSPLADAITEKAHQVLEKIEAALPHPSSHEATNSPVAVDPVAVPTAAVETKPRSTKSAARAKAAPAAAPAAPKVFKVKRGQKHR